MIGRSLTRSSFRELGGFVIAYHGSFSLNAGMMVASAWPGRVSLAFHDARHYMSDGGTLDRYGTVVRSGVFNASMWYLSVYSMGLTVLKRLCNLMWVQPILGITTMCTCLSCLLGLAPSQSQGPRSKDPGSSTRDRKTGMLY